jgi:hypothetical protein
MNRLSRLFLMAGCLAIWLAMGMLFLLAWPLSVLFVLGVFVRRFRTRLRLTTLGSARWAGRSDLQRAGMLNAESGLILGRLIDDSEEG